MANRKAVARSDNEKLAHKQTIESANLSADCEKSSHAVQIIVKDEEIRKLRVRILLLEDEVSHCHDELVKEGANVERVGAQLDLANDQVVELESQAHTCSNELKSKTRELEMLKAELSSMSNVSSDATKAIIEKLALAREISSLKPEIASLRAQVQAQKDTLAEKLAIQRQLTTVQVELENAQRTIQRAATKMANNHDRSEFELQLDEVHKQLSDANRARKLAEIEVKRLTVEVEEVQSSKPKNARDSNKIERLTTELHQLQAQLENAIIAKDNAEKNAQILAEQLEHAQQPAGNLGKTSKKEEKVAELRGQLTELKSQLKSESQARQKADARVQELKQKLSVPQAGDNTEELETVKLQLETLKLQLQTEKKERQRAEKTLERESTAWEAQKSVLDDKLDQFRTKLRSTKDKFKTTQQELEEARSNPDVTTQKVARNPRKRGASQLDETMLGTPGDGPQVKRNKRAGSLIQRAAVGEKSSFSITPFLNRTMSLAPESPKDAESPVPEPQKAAEAKQPMTAIEAIQSVDLNNIATDSPTTTVVKAKKPAKSKPLSQASSSKHNARSRKSARPPTLEKVLEEPSRLEEENASPTNTKAISDNTTSTATTSRPSTNATATIEPTATFKLKAPSQKPRKSLMSFASFAEEPAPEKKKKRKLGAGASGPKTLFDEEEEDKAPSKPIPGRGLFAAARANAKPFLFGAKKGAAMAASDVTFQFSPLKKDRRAMNSFIA